MQGDKDKPASAGKLAANDLPKIELRLGLILGPDGRENGASVPIRNQFLVPARNCILPPLCETAISVTPSVSFSNLRLVKSDLCQMWKA